MQTFENLIDPSEQSSECQNCGVEGNLKGSCPIYDNTDYLKDNRYNWKKEITKNVFNIQCQ